MLVIAGGIVLAVIIIGLLARTPQWVIMVLDGLWIISVCAIVGMIAYGALFLQDNKTNQEVVNNKEATTTTEYKYIPGKRFPIVISK